MLAKVEGAWKNLEFTVNMYKEQKVRTLTLALALTGTVTLTPSPYPNPTPLTRTSSSWAAWMTCSPSSRRRRCS